MAPIIDVDNAKASKVFDVNVFAPISVTTAFIPLLIVAKGTIVNVGSYVDALPVPWQGIYNASKAALRAITDNLRLEVRPFNVDVVYVRPSCFLIYYMWTCTPNYFTDCGWRNPNQLSRQFGDAPSERRFALLPSKGGAGADYEL